MSTPITDFWTEQTEHLWMAVSSVYPRIAVVGESEAEALALLDERREWWRNLPEIEPSTLDTDAE